MLDKKQGEQTSPMRELLPDETEAVAGGGKAPFPLPGNPPPYYGR